MYTFTYVCRYTNVYTQHMLIYGRIYTKLILVTLRQEEEKYVCVKENAHFVLYTLLYIILLHNFKQLKKGKKDIELV